MQTELITKYKVSYLREDVITHEEKPNSLIFDTKEEALEWCIKAGVGVIPSPVKGKMVSKFQATSFASLGIYGRNVKVWEEV
jgi:hypothetical protein